MIGAQLLPVSSRPRVRDVTTLSTWIACFLTFFAAGTFDTVTRDHLAYAILIVKEATRYGGLGGWSMIVFFASKRQSIRCSLTIQFIRSCTPLLFLVSSLLFILYFVCFFKSVIMSPLNVHCCSCKLLRLPLELGLVYVVGVVAPVRIFFRGTRVHVLGLQDSALFVMCVRFVFCHLILLEIVVLLLDRELLSPLALRQHIHIRLRLCQDPLVSSLFSSLFC